MLRRIALLHCNPTYPAPFKDINLKYIEKLERLSGVPVGYSSHERGIHIASSAVALGACIIEKHFTLDRNQEGNDHKVSLLPNELEEMITSIREVELAVGSSANRYLSQGELMNREILGKSIYAKKDLNRGKVLTEDVYSTSQEAAFLLIRLILLSEKANKRYRFRRNFIIFTCQRIR